MLFQLKKVSGCLVVVVLMLMLHGDTGTVSTDPMDNSAHGGNGDNSVNGGNGGNDDNDDSHQPNVEQQESFQLEAVKNLPDIKPHKCTSTKALHQGDHRKCIYVILIDECVNNK